MCKEKLELRTTLELSNQVPGRGFWSVGSKDIIMQVPKLDQSGVTSKINELLQKFNGDNKPNKPMLFSMNEITTGYVEKVVNENNNVTSAQKAVF